MGYFDHIIPLSILLSHSRTMQKITYVTTLTILALTAGCFHGDHGRPDVADEIDSGGNGTSDDDDHPSGDDTTSGGHIDGSGDTSDGDGDGGTTDGATDSSTGGGGSTGDGDTTSGGETTGDADVDNPCAVAPVAHWRLDELEGLVAVDSAPGANHGIHQGGPTPVAGSIGNALQFDGIDDYVQVLSADELNFGVSDFAITYSIKTASLDTNYILRKRNSGQLIGYQSYIQNGRIGFGFGDGVDSSGYDSGLVIADDRWHDVRISVDRDSVTGGRFYIDDVLVHEFDPTGHQGLVSNENPLNIGRSTYNGGSSFLVGALDEIRIYDQACE